MDSSDRQGIKKSIACMSDSETMNEVSGTPAGIASRDNVSQTYLKNNKKVPEKSVNRGRFTYPASPSSRLM